MNLMSRRLFYYSISIIFMKIFLPSFYEISTLLRATIFQPILGPDTLSQKTVFSQKAVYFSQFDHELDQKEPYTFNMYNEHLSKRPSNFEDFNPCSKWQFESISRTVYFRSEQSTPHMISGIFDHFLHD